MVGDRFTMGNGRTGQIAAGIGTRQMPDRSCVLDTVDLDITDDVP